MKGTFSKKEMLEGFINPLKNFSPILGDNGLVINFTNDDDTIVAKINAINQSVGTVIKSTYKNLFDEFEKDDEEECKIGVLRLAEFVNLFSLFNDDSVDFEFDETTKELKLTQGKANIIYKTADPDLIKEFNKPFSGSVWYSSFVYNDDFSKFTRAMSVLTNEECIIVEGSSGDGVVDVTIRNKNVVVNSYKIQVETAVSEDFSMAYKKDVMSMILSPKYDSINLSIGERVCMVETTSKYNDTVFYIAKMTK